MNTVLLELLARCPSVQVMFDARKPGVVVPAQLAALFHVILRFGYRVHPPIADLEVTDTAISGTLCFGGSYVHCTIPFSAIYAVQGDGEPQLVLPENIPPEVLASLASAPTPSAPAARSRLTSVPQDATGGAVTPPSAAAPFLRVVK